MKRTLFLAATAGALTAPALAQRESALHVITLPVDAGSEAFYAVDTGAFKAAGIDATVETMTNGGAAIAAVASGAADVAFSNLVSLVVAFKKGVPIRLVAGAGEATSKDSPSLLMALKGTPIHSARDLNGKTLGTDGLGTIAELAPRSWIDQNGGDSSTVKFVEIPFPQDASALEAHRIDAAMMPEPFLTANEAALTPIADPYPAIAPDLLIGAFFSTAAWAAANPDLLRRFAGAMRETARWANRNRAQSGEILAKYTHLDPKLLARMRRIPFAEKVTPELVQPTIDLVARYRLIDASFPAKTMIATGLPT